MSSIFEVGISRPFRREDRRDIHSADTIELIEANLGQILLTRAASEHSEGEVVWRQSMGSKMHLLRHRNVNPAFAELARMWILEAITQNEPRAVVEDVSVIKLIEGNTVEITVRWKPRIDGRVLDRSITTVYSVPWLQAA